ncbi:MAG: ATP-binding cassette domain-containing protein [Candidatus Krumholzibacteriia bacterium]
MGPSSQLAADVDVGVQPPAPAALEARGASKRYGTATALHPVDLEVPAGTRLALIGPSGGGKSTLLRLLVGLVAADTGEVLVQGKPLDRTSANRIRLGLGYVIQDGGLFPHLTAAENLSLQARHLGWSRLRIATRTEELAQLARLPSGIMARYPAELSGGQRQRVALMRALMLDPAVLLLDEPLGALDPLIRSELQQDLRRIFETLDKTVVLVTHDLAEARYLADRLVLLHQGSVVQDGTYADLTRRPAAPFVQRFVGAQRLIHGELSSVGDDLDASSGATGRPGAPGAGEPPKAPGPPGHPEPPEHPEAPA